MSRVEPTTTIATSMAGVFHSAGATHCGKIRRVNQDAFLDRGDIGLWIVADGVGGARQGDWSSRCVVDSFRDMAMPDSAAALLAETMRRLDHANALIRQHSQRIGGVSATTVVVLLIHSWFHTVLWAGDSRIYLLRDGILQLLSRDHSEVQALLDAGVITAQEALRHPRANVITRAIGGADELDVDRVSGRVLLGDRFLLCTDGVTKVMGERELQALLSDPSVTSIASSFIAAALTAGAPDNVTAIAVEIGGPDRSIPRATGSTA